MRFLGLDFACLTLHEAAEAIAARPADAPFAYVVTPNADHLVRLSAGGEPLPPLADPWLPETAAPDVPHLAVVPGIRFRASEKQRTVTMPMANVGVSTPSLLFPAPDEAGELSPAAPTGPELIGDAPSPAVTRDHSPLRNGRTLMDVYQRAFICLLDSRVVALFARVFRLEAPPVVTGSDLTERLVSHYIAPGEQVVIIGLSSAWLPALVARYRLAPPAHYDPPMGFDRDPQALADVVAFVRAHPARLIFLATGSPRQEALADLLARSGGVTGTGLCIGASLEFLCGARTRAPKLVSRCSMEWAWRLAQEPRRLARRYLIESPKVIGLLWQQRRMAGRSRPTLRA